MAKGFEELIVYRLAEELADRVWDLVAGWDRFAKNSMGYQIVRSADSVGANIAEGSGRGTYKDKPISLKSPVDRFTKQGIFSVDRSVEAC